MKILLRFILANCLSPIPNIPGILKSRKMSPNIKFFYLILKTPFLRISVFNIFILFFVVLTIQ